VNRRSFLGAAVSGLGVAGNNKAADRIPIIDTHIHLFDTNRPQGVPWPEKSSAVLYRPALPERYRKIAVPLRVVGAIEIEASPWLEDNQWVLDIAAKDPIVVGTVGNIELGKPDFAKHLERFHRNPLFRGIRSGNLWGRKVGPIDSGDPAVRDLKLLSSAGLTLDVANPDPELVAAVVRITDAVPDLRVIVDHLPQLQVPNAAEAAQVYRRHLRELGRRPQVFVKLSQIFRHVGGQVPRDLRVYWANLDEIFSTFGEDRVLYGSDWPNCDLWREYPDVLALVQEYFAAKSRAANEKYFWKNSVRAYRWTKRDSSQPTA